MSIETTLVQSVVEAIKSLYGTDFNAEKIQLQKTRKEFEGDFTLVVFPFLALSKKRPEETAQEIGEYLKSNVPAISLYKKYEGALCTFFIQSMLLIYTHNKKTQTFNLSLLLF